ncbi:MAG: DUF116 domain-containing protein [Spirochaetes bacterium]|nr:DUF116 domain-containing protein [Spirochaetota bacterium]
MTANNVPTYFLPQKNSRNSFYSELSDFTDTLIENLSKKQNQIVKNYAAFIKSHCPESKRNQTEHMIEILISGTLWNNYAETSHKTISCFFPIINLLYRIRKNGGMIKKYSDRARGIISYIVLNHKQNPASAHKTAAEFKHLLKWLSATGEFKEEAIRLNLFHEYLLSLNETEQNEAITECLNLSDSVYKSASAIFSKYLNNTDVFLKDSETHYRYRENYFFINRRPNEYVMNMIGAEILNRNMKKDFAAKKHKAILLPTCMRNEENICRAESDGKELVCASCSDSCNIGIVSTAMKKYSVTVYLIPHSSDFSRFLIKWKNNKDTGLVGVACVLNLLTGGYEMKRLKITSQCVFLNYCGCQKHWSKNGIRTEINIERLTEIIR